MTSDDGKLNGFLGAQGSNGLQTYTNDSTTAAKVNFKICGDEPFDMSVATALAKVCVVELNPSDG